jgi:Concanavalin A-like lectin/glucanases superfamily
MERWDLLNYPMYIKNIVCFLLLCAVPAQGDMICDGVDDDLNTSLALSTFISSGTGSFMLMYKPTGTASSTGGGSCAAGEFVMGDLSASGYNTAISRNGNLSGADRLCVFNYDGTVDQIVTTYTTNAWTHLAWVHGSGTLFFYKDGVLVSSLASGNTAQMSVPLRLCNGNPNGIPNGEGVIAAPMVFSTALTASEIAVIALSRMHRVATSVPSGAWEITSCGEGANCNAIAFLDSSGNGRTLTATSGVGRAADYVGYPWGVE